MNDFELENWLPMEFAKGPPLPQFLNIYWPWYEEEVPLVVPPPALPYGCPYCDQSFYTLKELINHAAAAHPDQPLIGEITIEWA